MLPEGNFHGHPTWRIIPFSKWLITMISKSPNWGCSLSKWPKWLINGVYYLLTNWDDPPSSTEGFDLWIPLGNDLWFSISLETAKVQIRGHSIRQAVTHGVKTERCRHVHPGGKLVLDQCVCVCRVGLITLQGMDTYPTWGSLENHLQNAIFWGIC